MNHTSKLFIVIVASCSACEASSTPTEAERDPDSALFPAPSGGASSEESNQDNPWLTGLGGQTAEEADDRHGIDAVPEAVGPHGREKDTDDMVSPPLSPPPDQDPLDGDPEPPSPRLLLRRYREGAGSDKLLLVENLGEGFEQHCHIEVYANGGGDPWRSIPLPPVWEESQQVLLCTDSAAEWPCDVTISGSPYNGNDALVVTCAGKVIDSLGQVGFDPGDAWTAPNDESITTQDADLLRCGEATDTEPHDTFALEVSWIDLEPGDHVDRAEIETALERCSPQGMGGGAP